MDVPARNVGLRRGVLAVCVLDDISLVPGTDGIVLEAGPDEATGSTRTVAVSWSEIATAVGPVDPESGAGRWRLRDWLRFRALFAELGSAAAWRAEQAAVPLGLPTDHPCTRAGSGCGSTSWAASSTWGSESGAWSAPTRTMSPSWHRSWPRPSGSSRPAGGPPCAPGSRTWAS